MMAHRLGDLGDNGMVNMSLIRKVLEFGNDLDLYIRPWGDIVLRIKNWLGASIEVSYRRRNVKISCCNSRFRDAE